MKETTQELLSRILDEDVSEFEIHRILKEMKINEELRGTFHRYNVIGHAIRKELPTQFSQNFVDSVMNKIDDEEMTAPILDDVIDSEYRSQIKDSSRFKNAIGLAIAASVAVVSFVSFQNYIQNKSETVPAAMVADRVVEQSDIQRVSSEELQNFITNPKAAASFNSYIMNHTEYASPRVSLPHVRIVGYDKDELSTNN
jgi:sigma-E factor negative regulatory protein RseA